MKEKSILNFIKNKSFWIIHSVVMIVFLVSLVITISNKNWIAVLNIAILILLVYVPLFLDKKMNIYIPFTIRLFIGIFGFLTLILGEVYDFYGRFAFWDKFLHFQSGLLFGLAGYILIYNINEHSEDNIKINPIFITIFIITFGLAIGVIWEIIEFGIDGYFGSQWQASNADTMWDIIFDGLGAFIVGIVGYFWIKHHKKIPLAPIEE